MTVFLNTFDTAARLPYDNLVREIVALLCDTSVQVPQRLVQSLPGNASLFVMPALDARLAIVKLITFTPNNAGTGRAVIQGDVVVFDVATGVRTLVLDGPAVTARRTAAVSLLAAQQLAPCRDGPLLVIGAGAQGRAHLDAFAQGLPIKSVRIASRSPHSAQALMLHARTLGLEASVVSDPDAALAQCPLVVTSTPGQGVVLSALPRDDAFIAAVGAFTPAMVELDPALCRHCLAQGSVVLDTDDARHEAGDLLQAELRMDSLLTLRDVVAGGSHGGGSGGSTRRGPVLFKSCGWAGWDLAAARVAQAV